MWNMLSTGLTRGEYQVRAHEFCKRGNDLPQSKLNDDKVRIMRRRHERALALVKRIHARHSIKAIANDFGVHERTAEKVLNYTTWRHVK
jgi:AraC-like DNA-binding protein